MSEQPMTREDVLRAATQAWKAAGRPSEGHTVNVLYGAFCAVVDTMPPAPPGKMYCPDGEGRVVLRDTVKLLRVG